MKGVVMISSVFEKRDILQVPTTKPVGKGSLAITEEEIVDVLNNAKVYGRLPALIFEIERGQDTEQKACVSNVCSFCKPLNSYKKGPLTSPISYRCEH
jgi:hypothetical protein